MVFSKVAPQTTGNKKKTFTSLLLCLWLSPSVLLILWIFCEFCEFEYYKQQKYLFCSFIFAIFVDREFYVIFSGFAAVVYPAIMHKQNEYLMLHLITFQHDIIEYFMFPCFHTLHRSRDIIAFYQSLEVKSAKLLAFWKCHRPRLSGFTELKKHFPVF